MNRKKMMIKAAVISVIVFVIQAILTLIRTKVFIEYYGIDSNGIVQLSKQIFDYLVLLESGLGAAYLYKMYEPMAKKKYKKINCLYKGLTNSLKKISIYMLLVMSLVAIIYPFIINKNSLSYIQISLILMFLGIRFIIPYYFTISKKNLLYIYEKKYIVDLIDGVINSIILMLEIILPSVFKIDILYTLFIGIIITLLSNYIYLILIKRNCKEIIEYDNCKPNYEANKMTKDIIVHQISGVVFSSTDSIILSIFSTLKNVTIYSAYNMILSYPANLMNNLVDNLRATFGKKIVEDRQSAINLFYETISLNYLIVFITAPLFYILINDFIILWLGKKFILPTQCIIIWTLLYIHRLVMPTVYIARDGLGLYKESKYYTSLQAIVNIILSLILLNKFGIFGLLIGTLLSTYLILIPFNYHLVCKKVLKDKNKLFVYLFLSIVYVLIMSLILQNLNNYIFNTITWYNFINKIIFDGIITTAISFILFFNFNKSFKKTIKRFIY